MISENPLVNYFNAFGFIKVPGLLKSEVRSISKAFDVGMKAKYGTLSSDRHYLYPQMLDECETLHQLLEHPKLTKIISDLLGEDFLYKGSDGNIFTKSTPWHRDYLIRGRSCKVLIYLQESKADSGALRVIPGTQFVDDSFSSFVGEALTWPEPPIDGGFDEKGIFGQGHNPIQFGFNRTIPQTAIATEPGDVIIFNHNLIHCTNATRSPHRRRLLGLHFAKNPETIEDLQLRQVVRNELIELAQVEMSSFQLPRMFGSPLLENPSEKIQSRLGILKELKLETSESFNGLYSAQGADSLALCNRLKSKKYLSHLNSN